MNAKGKCETIVYGGMAFGKDAACGEVAASIVTAGCVHEHIERGPICRRHQEQLDSQHLVCPSCLRGRDPHRCLMTSRVTA